MVAKAINLQFPIKLFPLEHITPFYLLILLLYLYACILQNCNVYCTWNTKTMTENCLAWNLLYVSNVLVYSIVWLLNLWHLNIRSGRQELGHKRNPGGGAVTSAVTGKRTYRADVGENTHGAAVFSCTVEIVPGSEKCFLGTVSQQSLYHFVGLWKPVPLVCFDALYAYYESRKLRFKFFL